MCVYFFFICVVFFVRPVCVCLCVNESQRVHHALCCTLFHPSLYVTQTLLFPSVFMHPFLLIEANTASLDANTRAQLTHACMHT